MASFLPTPALDQNAGSYASASSPDAIFDSLGSEESSLELNQFRAAFMTRFILGLV